MITDGGKPMRSKFFFVFCLFFLLMILACSEAPQNESMPVITMMTHDSFSVSKEVVEKFERQVQAKWVILKSGDAGEALNKAVLSRNNPLADLFYGVDNTFLGRALAAEMFLPYAPAHLSSVPEHLRLDNQNRLIPVDYGDVCINYDIEWFQNAALPPPARLEDLILPAYNNLSVVQNPATSSPGLAFLFATVSRFGQDGYLDFWQKFKQNGVLITNGWKEAYWGHFTAASKGDRPIVVSYASSPAAEVFFAEEKPATAPTGTVLENGAAFRQIEFAGIFNKTRQPDLARKAMDFLLSTDFQADIPLQMFVFPANADAPLPNLFQKHARTAAQPAVLDPQLIDEKREAWIREWTDALF